MNKINRLILASVALSCLTTVCSDEAKYKAMEDKYKAIQVEKSSIIQ